MIIIIGILVAGSTNLLTQGFRSFTSEKNIMDENWQTTVVLESMARDLRAIRSSADITSANNISITFNTTNVSTITYSLNGTTLGRTEQSNYQPLADNQQNLTLEYYDSNGAAANTSNTASIRYITVNTGSQNPTMTIFPWNVQ